MSQVLLPTLSDPTVNVSIEATQICALEPIPTGGTRISLDRGTSEITTAPFVDVTGTVAANLALLAVGGALAASFLDPAGLTVAVNPAKVVAIEQASPTSSRISISRSASRNTDGPFLTVQATVAAVRAVLNALSVGAQGTNYVPILTSSGAGVLAVVGPWRVIIVGSVVMVTGGFNFTPAAAGVAETIRATLPPGFPGNPTPFGAIGEATGVAQSPALATDFATRIQATVGAVTVESTITSNGAPSALAFSFSYLTST